MGDAEALEDYRGLSLRHPLLAAVFALALLSLTGMPLTAGFIAKFYIFAAAAEAKLWGLLIVGIVNSGISAFYYLRVVVAMYSRADAEPAALPKARAASALCLAVCAAVVLFFGIYPAPLIQLSQAATRLLGF
jgi:NADH-quinone oxidoreductase subunit N